MNLSYFRKSKFNKEETVSRLKEEARAKNLNVIGETPLPQANGVLVNVCNHSWVDQVLKLDRNLVALLPCSMLIVEKDGQVYVGAGNPTVIGSVSENPIIHKLAIDAEEKMRELVNSVSGAGEMKPVGIKLYSTNTCPYCKMEKQWLDANKVPHEVIYVDQNQAEAEKLVRNTGQMGVPVTEIQYEDAEPEYVIGFNKPVLAKIMGVHA